MKGVKLQATFWKKNGIKTLGTPSLLLIELIYCVCAFSS
jgi:hypothetical protein